ncbi:MAG: hypothetical protein WBY44_27320 [Bryobacteraceae bacterium]
MKKMLGILTLVAILAGAAFITLHRRQASGAIEVHRPAAHDVSAPLASLRVSESPAALPDCAGTEHGCGTSPDDDDADADQQVAQQGTPPTTQQGAAQGAARGGAPRVNPGTPPITPPPPIPPAGVAVEQHSQGNRPPAVIVASFDGLGFGFNGPQGPGRNAALDNSLAVGPNHIVQVINGAGIAVYSKKGALFDTTGKVLYGAVPSRTVFKGFGGPCETANFGDVVARYDQLADRWLYVMPIFQRIPNRPEEPYSVCYALSKTPDPLGEYYRYEFRRKLFPDYPRPAIWPDGYYVPTSTGDTVIQKHDCIVDRAKMLKGEDATEQCIIIDGVNFLNNSDIDGTKLPPPGAPNIMFADGGTQLKGMSEKDDKYFQDDGMYYWKVKVDWENPKNTAASGPTKIIVAPYHFLCNGQLSNCVPQPGTETRLDSQGDKLMQRLVYRNFGDHQSILAVHSINSSPGKAGGVRWYEFRIDSKGDPSLYQQSTYAPDEFFRWMGSGAMDRMGDIGIGYSFGGPPNYVGQRFAARLAGDPLGQLTLHETVLATGEGSQMRGNRWEDYPTTAMDPSDDCTFWYVGDYFKKDAPALTTKIGGFRLPGCMQARLSGSAFFDLNHDGKRDAGEPGIAGVRIAYSGGQSGTFTADAAGDFGGEVPADPLYQSPTYTLNAQPSKRAAWTSTGAPLTISIADPAGVGGVNLGAACTVPNRGGEAAKFWSSSKGKAVLNAHDPAWVELLNSTLHLNLAGKSDQAYNDFKKWLSKPGSQPELAALALNIAYGSEDGKATVQDPVTHDWPTLNTLVTRIAALPASAAGPYLGLLEKLNNNKQQVTPSDPKACGTY